jgi:hypothetical protein
VNAPLVVVDVTRCRADLALIDVLMRVVLVSRRLGARVEVVGLGPPLRHLLALTGLDGALDAVISELGGQPEALEEPGVEEVVDVGDLPVTQLDHLDGPGQEPTLGPGLVLGEGG